MEVKIYYWSAATYEKLFEEVGFVDFKWIPTILDPMVKNSEYWKDALENHFAIAFSSRKP